MPSAEVNSVMMRPHPPRLRMKRRKTVSVTPAMGARIVAGEIVTAPNRTVNGTGIWAARLGTPAPGSTGLSQNLRTLFILRVLSNRKPCRFQGYVRVNPYKSAAKDLLLNRLGLGVLPAESLHAAGRVDQLLLAGKEWVAVRADFYVNVALVSGAGGKAVAARAHDAHFIIRGMDAGFHLMIGPQCELLDSKGGTRDSANSWLELRPAWTGQRAVPARE